MTLNNPACSCSYQNRKSLTLTVASEVFGGGAEGGLGGGFGLGGRIPGIGRGGFMRWLGLDLRRRLGPCCGNETGAVRVEMSRKVSNRSMPWRRQASMTVTAMTLRAPACTPPLPCPALPFPTATKTSSSSSSKPSLASFCKTHAGDRAGRTTVFLSLAFVPCHP
jgi:hypothetical protein